jgi:hypothetical protein
MCSCMVQIKWHEYWCSMCGSFHRIPQIQPELDPSWPVKKLWNNAKKRWISQLSLQRVDISPDDNQKRIWICSKHPRKLVTEQVLIMHHCQVRDGNVEATVRESKLFRFNVPVDQGNQSFCCQEGMLLCMRLSTQSRISRKRRILVTF